MDIEKVFKNLILIFGVYFVVFLLKSLTGITSLSQELVDYSVNLVSPKYFVHLLIWIISFISLFFLYSFKRIGKIIFVLTWSLLMLSPLIYDEVIIDGTDWFLDSMGAALGSIIFFMLYFSPIKDKFESQ